MGDESSVPKDVLWPIFRSTNSTNVQEALETLVEASRTVEGRSELASRKILPAVLQLSQSLRYPSDRQCLILSLKLIRNLCAGEIVNQNLFIEHSGVDIVLTLLRSIGLVSDYGIVRMALQVLANVSLAGEEHQLAVWDKCFPVEFIALTRFRSQDTCDPLCMIIYSCCDGNPGLITQLCGDQGFVIIAEIVRTTSAVGFEEDWLKLLFSRICLEEIYFAPLFAKLYNVGASEDSDNTDAKDVFFSSEQAFLLRIISEILNERISEITVHNDFALCILGIFKRSVGIVDFFSRGKSGLPTSSTAIDVLGYSLTLLRDICALGGQVGHGANSTDVVNVLLSSGLLELVLSLLQELEPPAIIKKALKQSDKQEATSSYSTKLCPYKGFRRDIVAVIGNSVYRRKCVQDEIRQKNGILLMLQQCVTDENNPFLREWGIWSVRNLLEGNAENQKAVTELELQGSVDVPELAELGIRVEIDEKTRRAKLVNVS